MYQIVTLGKSLKWKGLWDLFRALEIVRKEVPNIKLIMYGFEPHLKQHCPVPCVYHVNVDDNKLAELYSLADAVVIPSWYESSPLPPLEAMACGAPIVTTRHGTEDYCINEYNSLVAPARNVKALAQAIIRILKDEGLRESIRKNGLKMARRMTWDRTASQVEDIVLRFLS